MTKALKITQTKTKTENIKNNNKYYTIFILL